MCLLYTLGSPFTYPGDSSRTSGRVLDSSRHRNVWSQSFSETVSVVSKSRDLPRFEKDRNRDFLRKEYSEVDPPGLYFLPITGVVVDLSFTPLLRVF